MMADDRALRVRGLLPKELATALVRFGTAGADGAPAGALAVAEGELTARVLRLLTPPPPLSRAAQAAVVLTAALVVATPLLLLITPLKGQIKTKPSIPNGPLFHPFGRPE